MISFILSLAPFQNMPEDCSIALMQLSFHLFFSSIISSSTSYIIIWSVYLSFFYIFTINPSFLQHHHPSIYFITISSLCYHKRYHHHPHHFFPLSIPMTVFYAMTMIPKALLNKQHSHPIPITFWWNKSYSMYVWVGLENGQKVWGFQEFWCEINPMLWKHCYDQRFVIDGEISSNFQAEGEVHWQWPTATFLCLHNYHVGMIIGLLCWNSL